MRMVMVSSQWLPEELLSWFRLSAMLAQSTGGQIACPLVMAKEGRPQVLTVSKLQSIKQ